MPEDWRVANEASHFRNDKGRLQGNAVVTYIEQKDRTESPVEVRTARRRQRNCQGSTRRLYLNKIGCNEAKKNLFSAVR